jgi:serine/threonine protein kinase
MKLDTSKYWIKYLTEEVFDRGLGLFTDGNTNRFDVGPGLEHMGRALTLLYQHEAARELVAFPLSVRSPNCLKANALESDCYYIIYEDLSSLGYRIGTPNRVKDEESYQRFLMALRYAVNTVHSAGVLHCDLYPSNFMWRCNDDVGLGTDTEAAFSIKIIDWDCAHCLAEGAFRPRIANALKQHTPTRSSLFGVQHDLSYIEVLEGPRNDSEVDDMLWEALASNNKALVDRAFYELFCRK